MTNTWKRWLKTLGGKSRPRRPVRLGVERVEDRITPVLGQTEFPFSIEPYTVVNGGDNLMGVVDVFAGGDSTGGLIDRGGVVVGSRHVISAAHCFTDGEEQDITFSGTGTYRLSLGAFSATISTGATRAQVESALRTVAGQYAPGGSVTVADLPGNVWRVAFTYGLNAVEVPEFVVSNLTGTAAASVVEQDEHEAMPATATVSFYMPAQPNGVPNGELRRIAIEVPASNIWIHPNWAGDRFPGAADLAVITLPVVAPLGASYYGLYDSAAAAAVPEVTRGAYFMAGYGSTGTGAAPGGETGTFIEDEYQRLRVNATGGTYRLGRNGNFTDPIPFNATAAQIEAALEHPVTGIIGVAEVRLVTGPFYAGTFEIQVAAPTNTNVAQFTVDTSGLTGTASVNTIQNGGRRALRFGDNVYNTVEGDTLVSDFDNNGTDEFEGAGDSGGGGFFDLGGGNLVIASVVSYGGYEFGDTEHNTRVSTYSAAISSVINAAPYPLVIDMREQVIGDNDIADTIEVDQVGANLEIRVNGQLYYRDAVANISSLRIVGSEDNDTVRLVGPLSVPSIAFEGRGGADALEVIGTAGDPIPAGGVTFAGGGNINTVRATADVNFTLTDAALTLGGFGAVTFTDATVTRAELTGGAGANTFNVTGWTGTGSLTGGGGADTVRSTKDADVTLTNTTLDVDGGPALDLAGVGRAELTGGGGNNRFTVGGWTGTGVLSGGGGTDTVDATKDANFTLDFFTVAASDGMSLGLLSVEEAGLTGGASANSFTVSAWFGSGVRLSGRGGNDTYTVTLNGSGATAFEIRDNGNGTDTLTANTTNNPDVVVFDAPVAGDGQSFGLGAERVTFGADVETLNLNTFAGADDVTIIASAATAINFDAGTPVFPADPGDHLTLGGAGGTVEITGPGTGRLAGDGLAPVTYVGVDERLRLTGNVGILVSADSDPNGNASDNGDADTFTVVNTGGEVEVVVNGTAVAGFDPAAAGRITYRGSNDDDTATVDNGGGLIRNRLTFLGGGGDNPLRLVGDPAVAVLRQTYASLGGNDGLIVLDPDGSAGEDVEDGFNGDEERIEFFDTTRVDDSKPAGQLNVFARSGNGADAIRVADAGTITDGAALAAARVEAGFGFTPLRFARKGVVTISALDGADVFTVENPTPAAGLTELRLYGSELVGTLLPDDAAADVFHLRATGVPTAVYGQGGDDAVRVSSTAGVDTEGRLDGIAGALTLDGGAGTNTLFVSDFSSATANAAARIAAATITGLAGPTDAVAVGYTGFAALTVRASNAAGDRVSVASPAAVLTLTTEGGNDQVTVASLTAPAQVFGGAGNDGLYAGGGTVSNLLAPLVLDGGADYDDLQAIDFVTVGGQQYTLTASTLARSGGVGITYLAVEQMLLAGAFGNNTYDITSTGATVSTTVSDFGADSLFTIRGDGLLAANTFLGGLGNDQFVLNAGVGISGTSVRISGGDGRDDLDVNARVGNDVVTVRVTATTGGGTLSGLGLTADFDSLERIDLDGKDGRNSLNWVDDTNQAFGTALTPEAGLVVRPLGAASGDVRIGLAETQYPTVAFVNVGGDFTVSGDGDGSGDRDVLTVLGASTAAHQSAWGELVSPTGVDAIDVTDRRVTLTSTSLGELRSVALADAGASPTVSTLLVRGGAEARPFGDNFTAAPSARVNLLLDGMDPTSGRPGDNLKVSWTGSRSLAKSRDPLKGPEHARFVQDADGASVGFQRFEKVYDTQVAVTGTGPGTQAGVVVSDPTTGKPRYAALTPFPGFFGGVSVASADVTGDGVADVVVGAGNGGGPVVVVYDGIEGTEVTRFAAYEESFRGGVIVSAADVNGDGFADVVTGTGVTGGPRVIVLSGKDRSVLANYFAYESSFRDGVLVAAGDTNGDGFADVLTGTGRGGAPRAVLFDGVTNQVRADFFVFDPNSRFGVSVALGDLDGDFISDLIFGDGSATEPRVRAFRGFDAGLLADFVVNDPFAPAAIPVIDRESGVRVGATDLDGDGIADILAGKGPGTRPVLRGYKVASRNPVTGAVSVGLSETHRETMFDPGVYGWGIEVGGSD